MPVTQDAFFELARSLSREAAIPADIHGYFEQHRDRLWQTIQAFDLLASRRPRVLEIGPYFAYTPFLWKAHVAEEVMVLDGAAPEPMLLEKLYRARGIEARFADLFQMFDESSGSPPRLPYENDAFDLVLCWETIEHFNFNPVPFVRELHRVTRPGGAVCATVPNLAKFDKRIKLLRGRTIATPVSAYHEHAGTKFFGFHWREYTLGEFADLFARAGFTIQQARHLQTFENRAIGPLSRIKRRLAAILTAVFPGGSSLCLVRARK